MSTELIGKDVGNIEAASIQLERYYILMATGLRELDLSYGEASALVDCLNLGNYMESVVGRLKDEIAFHDLDKKWKIDGQALISKLEGLNRWVLYAIIHAAETFWLNHDHYPKESREQGLKRVGLIR